MADQELHVTTKKEMEPETGEFTHEGVYFSPAVDIFGTEHELVLLADMPGISSSSVEIDLRDDTLSILGRGATETGAGESLLTEYQSGSYFRTFRLTDVIDQSKITASMSNGVLRVVLPKVEKALPRKIVISAD